MCDRNSISSAPQTKGSRPLRLLAINTTYYVHWKWKTMATGRDTQIGRDRSNYRVPPLRWRRQPGRACVSYKRGRRDSIPRSVLGSSGGREEGNEEHGRWFFSERCRWLRCATGPHTSTSSYRALRKPTLVFALELFHVDAKSSWRSNTFAKGTLVTGTSHKSSLSLSPLFSYRYRPFWSAI